MPDITQAPTILKLGGQDYTLEVLGDDDIEELTNWLRSDVIKMAHDSLTDSMTKAERSEILDAAIAQARGLSWISGAGAEAMASLNGIARVIWQGLRRNYPDLTHAQVRKLICDKRTIDYAMSVWRELNIGDAVRKGGPSQSGDPKAHRRSTRHSSRKNRRNES